MKRKKGKPGVNSAAKELSVEDAEKRLGVLMDRVGSGIVSLYETFEERGTSATWVAALFDTSDEKGMRAYHALMPGWHPLPPNGVIAVGCPLAVVEEAAWSVGYKRSPEQMGTYVAGRIRVVAFTLGVIAVKQARMLVIGEGEGTSGLA